MNYRLKAMVAAAALSVIAASSQAATVTIGTLTASTPGSFAGNANLVLGDTGVLSVNPLLRNSSTTAASTFFDDFVFTVPVGSTVAALSATLQNTLTGFIGITGFTETLYSGGGTLTSFSALTTNPFGTQAALATGSSTTALAATNLGAGTYTLQFSGTLAAATSLLGVAVPTVGTFVSLVNIAPVSAVPEPSSYALVLAGLGLLTVIARQRKGSARV
jgi:hypothetical protein